MVVVAGDALFPSSSFIKRNLFIKTRNDQRYVT